MTQLPSWPPRLVNVTISAVFVDVAVADIVRDVEVWADSVVLADVGRLVGYSGSANSHADDDAGEAASRPEFP